MAVREEREVLADQVEQALGAQVAQAEPQHSSSNTTDSKLHSCVELHSSLEAHRALADLQVQVQARQQDVEAQAEAAAQVSSSFTAKT